MWPPARDVLRRPQVGLALGVLNQPYALARCYGDTDKAAHGYMRYYRRHLGPLRWRRNVVLEIGVGAVAADAVDSGGSLKMWRDYFPRSRIAGMDILPKQVDLGGRVEFFQGDQSSPDDLERVASALGHLDVVIDDGSHVGEHQLASFRALFPRLRPGGWYVIEDLSTSYSPAYQGAVPAPEVSGIGLVKQLLDAVQTHDGTFTLVPEWGPPPPTTFPTAIEVHTYPGIAFIRSAAQ